MVHTVEEVREYLLNLRDACEQEADICRRFKRDKAAPVRAAECDKQRRFVERILRDLRL